MEVVTCVRTVQSAQHIGQWLKFHLAVGFTFVHVLLDNKTTDGTERMLAPFTSRGVVAVQRIHMASRIDSDNALASCYSRVLATANDRTWFAVLDDDEVLMPMMATRNGVQLALRDLETTSCACVSVERLHVSSQVGLCGDAPTHFVDRFRLRTAKPEQDQLPKLVFRPRAVLKLAGGGRLQCAPPAGRAAGNLSLGNLSCAGPQRGCTGELRHGPARCPACRESHRSPGCSSSSIRRQLRIMHYSLNLTWRVLTHTSERVREHTLKHLPARESSSWLDSSVDRFLPLLSPPVQPGNVSLRLKAPGQLGNQLWECAVALTLRRRLETFGHTVTVQLEAGTHARRHPSVWDEAVQRVIVNHPCHADNLTGASARVPKPQRTLELTNEVLCRPEAYAADGSMLIGARTGVSSWDHISSAAAQLSRMRFATCALRPAADEIVVHVRNFSREFRSTFRYEHSHYREPPADVIVRELLSDPIDAARPVAVVGHAEGMLEALRRASPQRMVRLVRQSALDDLCFLASAQYRIVLHARSSFGWWGAFLSKARRVDAWAVTLSGGKPAVGREWNARMVMPTGQWGQNWHLVTFGADGRAEFSRVPEAPTAVERVRAAFSNHSLPSASRGAIMQAAAQATAARRTRRSRGG